MYTFLNSWVISSCPENLGYKKTGKSYSGGTKVSQAYKDYIIKNI